MVQKLGLLNSAAAVPARDDKGALSCWRRLGNHLLAEGMR
jgi:hypothetical protein